MRSVGRTERSTESPRGSANAPTEVPSHRTARSRFSASAPAANTWAYTPLQYAAIFGQQSVASTLLAAPGIELLAKDGRGETALDHAVGERQWAVAHLIADALDAAGALDAAPAVAAQVAQLREGAKAAAPAAELTPAERVRRNQEILAARKASRESN